ncbi:MAG: DUF1302 family protein [Limnochordia bacterium]|jgi:hypothetical protein
MRHRSWLILASLLVLAVSAQATAAELTGELSYDMHYLTETKGFDRSQLQYNLQLEGQAGFSAAYHLSFKGDAVYRPSIGAGWELDEAYVDVYLSQLDIRVGRQVINWGTADGINPTNDINPKGIGSLDALELKGRPVPAVMAGYYQPSGAGLTGVCVLDFVPADLPPDLSLPSVSGEPAGDGDQFEIALRGELPLRGWPLYLTYFNGWDDLPAVWMTLVDPFAPPIPGARYRRMQSVGMASAFDFRGASFWFEGAYKVPERLDELEAPMNLAMSSNDPYTQLVAGCDYSFDNGFYASAQVVYNEGGSLLAPFFDPQKGRQAQTYIMGRGQYSPRDGHDLELTALFNATDKGALLFPKYTYELAEATKLTLGAVYVTGSDDSEFADVKESVQGLLVGLSVSF